jgi:hypothetical protein
MTFSTGHSNNIPNFMKIHQLGAELFLAEGRTDIKLIVAFRSFAKAPKN